MGIGKERVGLQGGEIFEQAIQDIDRFPHPARDEVAEQRDIRITDVMIGNTPKAAVADMMRPQQIILHEGNMGAIRNGGLPTAPEKGQLKPGVLRNHIAQGGFQFGGRNMLGIQPS